MKKVAEAKSLAIQLYGDERRKDGRRIIDHVEEICRQLDVIWGFDKNTELGADVLAAAWLHEVFEIETVVRRDFIEKKFGPRVTRWIEIMTKHYDPEPDADWNNRRAKMAEIEEDGLIAIIIVDAIDGLKGMKKLSKEGQEAYIKKKQQLLETLKGKWHWDLLEIAYEEQKRRIMEDAAIELRKKERQDDLEESRKLTKKT